MKAFRFPLEAVRRLREQQERAAAAAYAHALREAQQASRRLQEIADQLASARAEFQERIRAKETALELKKGRDYLDVLDQRHTEAERELAILRSRADEAFVTTVTARKALTVLEKYSTTQERRHRRQQRRKEQKLLDDLWQSRGTLLLALQLGART